jgi:hypothetical protein
LGCWKQAHKDEGGDEDGRGKVEAIEEGRKPEISRHFLCTSHPRSESHIPFSPHSGNNSKMSNVKCLWIYNTYDGLLLFDINTEIPVCEEQEDDDHKDSKLMYISVTSGEF